MENQVDSVLANIRKSLTDPKELEYFWTHSQRYRFILQKIIERYPDLPPKKVTVLDVGCYPYHLGQALELLGFDVYGIASRHEPIKNNPKIKICDIENEKFPFPDKQFDLVLWTEVLEHLVRTPKIPLREIKRVMKSDGLCLITTPNVLRSINRFSLLVGRSIYPQMENYYDEKVGDASFNYRHNKEYTMEELAEIIKEVGMGIRHKDYFISYTPFRLRKIPDNLIVKMVKIFNYWLMILFPPLRDTLYLEVTSLENIN
jgi:SAM-dependent methyltransferase